MVIRAPRKGEKMARVHHLAPSIAALTQWAERRLLSEQTGVRILQAAPIHCYNADHNVRAPSQKVDR